MYLYVNKSSQSVFVVYLFPPVVLYALGILQHFSPPQLEEVIWVGVELARVSAVVAEFVQPLERRRPVAARVRRQHGRRHRVAGEQLLLECARRTERFPQLNILERDC